MSRLREMEMFVRVVDAGSFSSAARDLKIGQPAISKTIASLEDRLGVRLLVALDSSTDSHRSRSGLLRTRPPRVTEADEADAAARGASASLEGRLRISAAVTFSRLHLVPRLPTFLDVHPRLELELVMDDRPRDLVAENIDAALRLGVLTDSSLRARKLAQSERLVVASPAYLARRGFPHSSRSPRPRRHHLFPMDRRRGMVLPSWNRRNLHTVSTTVNDHRRRRRAHRRDQWARPRRRLALDVCARTPIRRGGLHPERLDATTTRPLGHLPLGPADQHQSSCLCKVVRRNHRLGCCRAVPNL